MTTNNPANVGLSGATGTGNFVGANTPTLITPVLGAATATSINFGGDTLSSYATKQSFTPGLTFGGGNTGITYTTQLGVYTQTGTLVQFAVDIVLSSKGSSTGTALITNLPFASQNTVANIIQVINTIWENVTYAAGTPCAAFATTNSTSINLYLQATATTLTALSDTNFGNTSRIYLCGAYVSV
jgi:hypothetical protein